MTSPPTGRQLEEQHAQDAQYYRGLLHDVLDMSAGLARQIHGAALAQTAPDAPAPDPVRPSAAILSFDLVARIIRRSIVLARHVATPLSTAAAMPPRIAARRRIIRAVEDAIQRHATGDDAEALHAEFLERLDGPDLDDDIDQRPVAELIAEICRDLGIDVIPGAHPWQRRTPADITTLCARAAKPSAAPGALPSLPSPLAPGRNPPLGPPEARGKPWHYSPGFGDP